MKSHRLIAAAIAATATRSAAFAFRPSLHSPPPPHPTLSSRGGSTVVSHYSSYSSSSTPTTLLLLATKRPNNDNNTRGFGPKRKYSIDDKSYGGIKSNDGEGGKTTSDDDPSAGMADFFATHSEWEPLFRGIVRPHEVRREHGEVVGVRRAKGGAELPRGVLEMGGGRGADIHRHRGARDERTGAVDPPRPRGVV